ncbi:hypothetical protein OAG1_06300 [Agarivorans sp. OAG1]|uniref:DUF2845 domain-containing protein n=1 Tax=Agarivorans albus MKT 106 TaxID=1331007 RepID=R9PU96_AGAAL|nr:MULTISPECIES: hypothetical protein [Agarivorans]MPW30496.1 hypothetical protein [Agarivorans sp. B2Z047]UQN42283.1 hypothetical protein LQZ07_21310 [Agarivorans sp. B2Z047]BEU01830.1 hypothetical protein OAG1_06300 [Agarivorans sp. OAG1]GAD03786.1 hypothetical protein AALB_3866 [Agarivorans albus MKT 106]
MKKHICLLLGFIAAGVQAGNGTEVANINCNGTWIRSGTDKLELISACGKPEYEEVVSGDNFNKLEGVLYNIKGKKYVVYLKTGQVVKIEWLR